MLHDGGARDRHVDRLRRGDVDVDASRPTRASIYNLIGSLDGRDPREAQELSPDYVTSVDNGVFHVRLREAPRELTEWLDRRIEKFDQKFENLRDAMQAVATIGAYHRAGRWDRAAAAPARVALRLRR